MLVRRIDANHYYAPEQGKVITDLRTAKGITKSRKDIIFNKRFKYVEKRDFIKHPFSLIKDGIYYKLEYISGCFNPFLVSYPIINIGD